MKHVEDLAKAEDDLIAPPHFDTQPVFGAAAKLPVTVEIIDARQQPVLRAHIAMWVSPKNG